LEAFENWADSSLEKRISYLESFHRELSLNQSLLTEAISKETGKPFWDAFQEVNAMLGKIAISVEAFKQRCPTVEKNQSTAKSITRHKPHGVVAVLGPFNFPGHLPNGHIVPALLAGNTVVFKPSECTPLVAALTIECWRKANLPPGVINLVQGGKETGISLISNSTIAGLFFTGSVQTGRLILEKFNDKPEKILALEMGGNNPLIISKISDIKTACYLTIQSAFLTSGQRCTCARRLILLENSHHEIFLEELIRMIRSIKVGPYTENPQPFMGPVISHKAAQNILLSQEKLKSLGGKPLIQAYLLKEHTGLLSPGLLDSTDIDNKPDEEIFGPLLQIIRVKNFEEAIHEANQTKYGLSASLFSDSREEFHEFYRKIKAGIVNWNVALTGASSAAPFGGIGISGNHRPSAFYAADYCSYPVASLESEKIAIPSIPCYGISL
jgi:succinylglutamic semialdehyde dehydrogenase